MPGKSVRFYRNNFAVFSITECVLYYLKSMTGNMHVKSFIRFLKEKGLTLSPIRDLIMIIRIISIFSSRYMNFFFLSSELNGEFQN